MAFELKITATSADELTQQLSALALALHIANDPVMPEVKASVAAAPKTERKVKAEPTKVEEPKAEEPKASEPVTLDFNRDVLPRVFAITELKGRDEVVSLLSEFGVGKASQVPAEQFAEFIDAIDTRAEPKTYQVNSDGTGSYK